MIVYEFKVAQVEENELPVVMETETPTGAFKTLFAITETEQQAIDIVDAYVSKTKYADIEDKKVVK